MLTRHEVEAAPAGITYLTLGKCKSHIAELAGMMELLFSSTEDNMTDEQFRATILARLKENSDSIQELYDGFNFLADRVREHGIDIPVTGGDEESDTQ